MKKCEPLLWIPHFVYYSLAGIINLDKKFGKTNTISSIQYHWILIIKMKWSITTYYDQNVSNINSSFICSNRKLVFWITCFLPLTCLSWVVRGHGVVTHWWVAGVHGTTGWRPSVVGHWCSVVWLRPSRVHAWWRGPRVGSRSRSLPLSLSLGGGGSCSGGLLLHLLPRLHLGVFELLHVERLSLGEQLLPLKLQLHRDGRNAKKDD